MFKTFVNNYYFFRIFLEVIVKNQQMNATIKNVYTHAEQTGKILEDLKSL